MEKKYYDLCIGPGDLAEKILLAERLGWSGLCVSFDFDADYKSLLKELENAKKESKLDFLVGARISVSEPQDVQKKARAALEYADLILVEGGDEEINRAASECWEVDILCHPEKVSGKDLPDQKNSGVDHVIAHYMAERTIALEINFSELLCSFGMVRSQVMGRMRQNIMLAKKYGVPLIIASGGGDLFSLRAPRDLYSVCISLGMDAGFAKRVLQDDPMRIVGKARDRKNPDVIMKGLSVISRGAEKQAGKKKMSGWY